MKGTARPSITFPVNGGTKLFGHWTGTSTPSSVVFLLPRLPGMTYNCSSIENLLCYLALQLDTYEKSCRLYCS